MINDKALNEDAAKALLNRKPRSKNFRWLRNRWLWYVKYPWYDFKNGIKNIKLWLGVIWKDRNTDYGYTISILIHKLKLQRDYMSNYSYEEESDLQIHLDDMTETIRLLEAFHDDDYFSKRNVAFEEKWGESDNYFVPLEKPKDGFSMKDRNEEQYTPEQIEEKDVEWLAMHEAADTEKKADLQKAMFLIAEKCEFWWS